MGPKSSDCTACISPYSLLPNLGVCEYNATLAKLMGREEPLSAKDILVYIGMGLAVIGVMYLLYWGGMKWYMNQQAHKDRDKTAFVEHEMNVEQQIVI